jgi:hypothetical protein
MVQPTRLSRPAMVCSLKSRKFFTRPTSEVLELGKRSTVDEMLGSVLIASSRMIISLFGNDDA